MEMPVSASGVKSAKEEMSEEKRRASEGTRPSKGVRWGLGLQLNLHVRPQSVTSFASAQVLRTSPSASRVTLFFLQSSRFDPSPPRGAHPKHNAFPRA